MSQKMTLCPWCYPPIFLALLGLEAQPCAQHQQEAAQMIQGPEPTYPQEPPTWMTPLLSGVAALTTEQRSLVNALLWQQQEMKRLGDRCNVYAQQLADLTNDSRLPSSVRRWIEAVRPRFLNIAQHCQEIGDAAL